MHLSLIFSIFPGCFNSSLLEPMKMVLPSLHPVAACFDYCDNTSRIGLTVSVRKYLCTPKIIVRLREYIKFNLHVSSKHVVETKCSLADCMRCHSSRKTGFIKLWLCNVSSVMVKETGFVYKSKLSGFNIGFSTIVGKNRPW